MPDMSTPAHTESPNSVGASADGQVAADADRDRRALAAWAHPCLAKVLHVFWQQQPDDLRPSDAIDALAAFAAGRTDPAAVADLVAGCEAAASGSTDPAAAVVASACAAALRIATAESAAAQVPALTATAWRLGMPDDDWAREDRRQRESLPKRFTPLVYPPHLTRDPGRSQIDLRSDTTRATDLRADSAALMPRP